MYRRQRDSRGSTDGGGGGGMGGSTQEREANFTTSVEVRVKPNCKNGEHRVPTMGEYGVPLDG